MDLVPSVQPTRVLARMERNAKSLIAKGMNKLELTAHAENVGKDKMHQKMVKVATLDVKGIKSSKMVNAEVVDLVTDHQSHWLNASLDKNVMKGKSSVGKEDAKTAQRIKELNETEQCVDLIFAS